MKNTLDEKTKIAIFQKKEIRKTFYKDEWWFSVIDVVGALTDSSRPGVYWNAMKTRVSGTDGFQLSTICRQLKLESSDGKNYKTDCSNTEGLFRIIQSIPSPKAEPFKLWLAKVGYQRIQEIENPELATKRTRKLYKSKGYSDNWIEKRMRGIQVRETLTNEWSNRGAKPGRDYAILTSEISRATFGMTPKEYQKFKGLKRESLRDHMDDIELILTMFGEATTTRITQHRDSQRMPRLKRDAKDGGKVAGNARSDFERTLEKSIISENNYLEEPEDQKQLD
jgi:DNA-damage-inducible protein D